MRYHLFQKFFGKMVKIKETSFLSTREDTNFLPPLYDPCTSPPTQGFSASFSSNNPVLRVTGLYIMLILT